MERTSKHDGWWQVRWTSRVVLVVAMALVASACGSRAGEGIGQSDGAAGSRDDRLGPVVTSQTPGDSPSDAGFDSPSVAAPGSATQARGSASRPGGPQASPIAPRTPESGSATTSARRPPASGVQGVTDEEIAIGFTYTEDAQEANAALGATGVSQGEGRRTIEVLTEWLNERGGLAGRQVKPVYHVFSATSGTPDSVQQQEACETFGQDNEVFAIFTARMRDPFLNCIHRFPIALLATTGTTDADDGTFQRFPRWLEVDSYSLSAIGTLTPRGLNELGFFAPATPASEVRIGIMTYDDPRFRRALDEHLLPSLRAVGHEPAAVVYATDPDTLAQVSETSAAVSSAILRFRSLGVDHVLILDYNALITFLFLNQAENQGYRPAYGFNSHNGGQVLIDSDLAPAEQLRRVQAVGWLPLDDVVREQGPRWPAHELCRQIFRDNGIEFEDPNAEASSFATCDLFFFARAAVDVTSGPLSPETFLQGATALGQGFESAWIGPTSFSPAKRHGVARYNLSRFFDDCGCFRYVSNWRAVP